MCEGPVQVKNMVTHSSTCSFLSVCKRSSQLLGLLLAVFHSEMKPVVGLEMQGEFLFTMLSSQILIIQTSFTTWKCQQWCITYGKTA